MDSGFFGSVGCNLSLCVKARSAVLLAASLLLVACGGGSGGDEPVADDPGALPESPGTPTIDELNAQRDIVELDGVYPYVRSSQYADVLKDCALIDDFRDACTLDVLPFIIQDAPEPTVADVMSRVLVSHDWMGERFETLLRSSNDSLVRMFGSVTSILIGSTVRPSNYWGGTGGIQLDPVYLWMSVDEKMTISLEEDFRSDFGSDLQFLFFQARMKNGNLVSTTFNLVNDETRTLEDIRIPTLRLLYHELAHANDFLPRTIAPFLDSRQIPAGALDQLSDFWLSPQLVAGQPLNSSVMDSLAGVRYLGDDATDIEKTVTADAVGAEFANDGAAKFYGYSTIREDLATLVETAMLKAVFDIDVAAGFVDIPDDPDNAFCNDYIVGWGTRNRFSDPVVLSRAKVVLEGLFGSSEELDQFITAQQDADDAMTPGNGWCTERDLRATPAADVQADGVSARSAQRSRGLEQSSELLDVDRHAWAEEKRRQR